MTFRAYIDSIKIKTGKTPEDFQALAEAQGLLKQIGAWLTADYGLGHGNATATYSLLKPPTELGKTSG